MILKNKESSLNDKGIEMVGQNVLLVGRLKGLIGNFQTTLYVKKCPEARPGFQIFHKMILLLLTLVSVFTCGQKKQNFSPLEKHLRDDSVCIYAIRYV